jgi:alpha-beta hydrolase superfamily lysophospholipase
MKDTRRLASRAFPALVRFAPQLLSIYLNATSTDTSQAAVMIQTVEDPNPYVNGEIAQWIRRRELVVRGVNVSQKLREMTYPHLSIVAMNDGIVPPATSRAVYDQIGSKNKSLLEVGTADLPIAHADLFLSTGSQEKIFAPLARFFLSA